MERPNRFVAVVEIRGRRERVHVKNTGRCRELLTPGATVFLQDHRENMNSRKLRYSLIAVEKDRQQGKLLVNMDSQAPNKVVREALEEGRIKPAGMKELVRIKGEHSYGDSRLDFYLEDSAGAGCLVEVKGVTLEEDGIARFPDAPTQRGVKHMEELIRGRQAGYGGMIIFVIQMKEVRLFEPNDKTHPEFGRVLAKARAAGVEVLARDCLVTPDSLRIDQAVKLHIVV